MRTERNHIMNKSTGKKLAKAALVVAVTGAAFPVMLSLGAGPASAACQGEVIGGSTARITCTDKVASCTYSVSPDGPWTRCVVEGGINN
jgi:hypothetical protein